MSDYTLLKANVHRLLDKRDAGLTLTVAEQIELLDLTRQVTAAASVELAEVIDTLNAIYRLRENGRTSHD